MFVRASEAHLLAKDIADAGAGVILIPARMYPTSWERRRTLPGPPLTPQSAIGVLTAANVTVGLGIEEGWQARNQRFDLAWVRSSFLLVQKSQKNCSVFNPEFVYDRPLWNPTERSAVMRPLHSARLTSRRFLA